ncbi:MAG: helix-turn-helix domain-containing protein [Clostridia bacterium]|nr:helix-turn-helix domain-containing protein [Clostridia bacterium]
MDQEKIGKFIASQRKEKGLTQAKLAERLGISDRAVSKWETGRSMPDSSIMLELCVIIGLTVNDLLTGWKTTMENYKDIAEKTLIEMRRSEERSNRAMLNMEIIIGLISTAALLVLLLTAKYADLSGAWQTGLIITGFVIFIPGMYFCLRIETTAGYYECAECGHRYVPTLTAITFSPHMGRTTRMKCPKCGKKNWQKKVITTER